MNDSVLRPISLSERLLSFWNENKDWLETQYPGITYNRLKQEIESSSVGYRISPENFWKSNYGLWEQSKIDDFFTGLLSGRPLQYLTGHCHFYKSEFVVNENVLIPRSESEILVEMAIKYLQKNQNAIDILDLGTGSACLILSILREIKRPLNAIGSDISEHALAVAELNLHRLSYAINPESSIKFVQSDRMNNINQKFDLIISNPPYIKENEDIDLVHTQVKLHEPHVALFLPDEQYQRWFEKLFKQVFQSLKSNGLFLMEGHENHLKDLALMASKIGFLEVNVIKDYTERDRFLSLKKD